MIQLKNWSFLLLLSLFIFNSCSKDSTIDSTDSTDISNDDFDIPKPVVLVNASIGGTIKDQNGDYLAGVNITVNNNITQTDENGVFTFKNVSLNERGALITAELDGYYYNSKFVYPHEDEMSFTRMTMITKLLAGSFSSSTGGSVMTKGDAVVNIPANAIKTEGGEAYTGEVNVYATWLDPTADDLFLTMPGDLRAVNANDREVLLETYGMVGVELEGANGEALNIADGKKATIELPVPSSILASAPATIPLWHFDEVTGLWVEEGTATLQDGIYVGEVSHFSFWNCDVPLPFIWMEGRIEPGEGYSVDGIAVEIVRENNMGSGWGYTNSAGQFSGYIPNNELLTLNFKVSQDECEGLINTKSIGPFAENVTLPSYLPTDLPELIGTHIKGTLTCDGIDISNGYIRAEIDNVQEIIYPDIKGKFSRTIKKCTPTTTTFSITGYDLINLSQSEPATFEIEDGTTSQLGDINVCELAVDEYVTFTVGQVEHTMLAQVITSSFLDGATTVSIIDDQELYNITFRVPEVELHTDMEVTYFGALNSATTQGDWCSSGSCANLKARFSEFSLVTDGVIKGHITGTLSNENGEEVNVSFVMDAKVDY